jgi:hypothetical protein
MSDTLGFSVACYQGDVPLLRGCLASIRHFAPDAPICLIADGDFSTRAFEKEYGAVTIRRADVRNQDLRKWSFGFGLTKMVAFWEAPFDVVFHVDADAVLWGDIRHNLPDIIPDVVINEPHEIITPYIQKTQYFDPERIFSIFPEFDWKGLPYFQAGIVCVRRNQLDLDQYIRCLELQRKHPDLLVNGDQGILNLMVFSAFRAGKLNFAEAHLQSVVPVLEREELSQRFRIGPEGPIPWSQPTIIHWAGPKPYGSRPETFPEPMDYFRMKGMRETGWPTWIAAEQGLRWDEWRCRTWPKQVMSAKRLVKRCLGRRG